MKRSVGCLLFAYIGFAGGCGSAASEDYALPGSEPPTLFSLYGHITDSDRGAMVSGTRAAFVWFPASPGAGVQVSQDLGRPLMTDIFEMRIDVIQAPPPFPAGEGGREAELVFYMDGDGDDQLDVSSFGTPSPDRVVGRAPGSRVVWGSGASMDTSKAGPKKKTAPRVCSKEAPDFALSCGMDDDDPGSIPSAPIPIRFVNEEVLGGYTCARFWGSQEWSDDDMRFAADLRNQVRNGCSSPSVSESAGDSGCECKATEDGGWKACASDPQLCGTILCHVAARPASGKTGCP